MWDNNTFGLIGNYLKNELNYVWLNNLSKNGLINNNGLLYRDYNIGLDNFMYFFFFYIIIYYISFRYFISFYFAYFIRVFIFLGYFMISSILFGGLLVS